MLGISGGASCPLLSTLTLLGVLSIDVLSEVLKTRSNAGYRLERLRLGQSRILLDEVTMLVDYVGELEFFDEEVEPRGMELPAVCTTGVGEWSIPWTSHQV